LTSVLSTEKAAIKARLDANLRDEENKLRIELSELQRKQIADIAALQEEHRRYVREAQMKHEQTRISAENRAQAAEMDAERAMENRRQESRRELEAAIQALENEREIQDREAERMALQLFEEKGTLLGNRNKKRGKSNANDQPKSKRAKRQEKSAQNDANGPPKGKRAKRQKKARQGDAPSPETVHTSSMDSEGANDRQLREHNKRPVHPRFTAENHTNEEVGVAQEPNTFDSTRTSDATVNGNQPEDDRLSNNIFKLTAIKFNCLRYTMWQTLTQDSLFLRYDSERGVLKVVNTSRSIPSKFASLAGQSVNPADTSIRDWGETHITLLRYKGKGNGTYEEVVRLEFVTEAERKAFYNFYMEIKEHYVQDMYGLLSVIQSICRCADFLVQSLVRQHIIKSSAITYTYSGCGDFFHNLRGRIQY
jgi:hypothetical protein